MKAKVPIGPEKGGIENSHSAQLKFKTGSTPESNKPGSTRSILG